MGRVITSGLSSRKVVGIAVGAVAVVAAGCGAASSPSNSTGGGTTLPGAYGSIPAETGTPTKGGTLSFAEQPGTGPNYIFPITPSANSSVFVTYDFQDLAWRPLYWAPNGATPEIDSALSLASAPVFSNNDKTVTINMNQNYTWSSDGAPVDANDVVFDIDLVKAAVAESPANFGNYTPGYFPDNVTTAVATSKYTVTLTLDKAYNPGWFYDDQLDLVSPLPSTQWAKSSATGSQLDYTVPANATAIYNYLNAQSNTLSTYSTNPLWQDVDGPYRLTSYQASNQGATFTANTKYTGANKPNITTVEELPFTSTTAEFNQLLAGNLTVGYVDFTDLPQVSRLEKEGYSVFGYPDFGFEYMPFNFADTTDDFNNVISQLYVRQAFAHLEDEPAYVSSIFHGAAVAAYGPVPKYPASPYQPTNAATTDYPYSVSDATNLLTSHGWAMVNKVMVCQKPGTASNECGKGIPSGTKITANIFYANSPAAIQQQVDAFASAASQAGITITTTSKSFDFILQNYNNPSAPADESQWAMIDFGGFTNSIYPTTNTLFNTTGSYNLGSYSSSEANTLITNSVSGDNPSAVKTELSYIDSNLPGVFQPAPDLIFAWKNSVQGPTSSFSTLTQYFFNPEEWYLTSK